MTGEDNLLLIQVLRDVWRFDYVTVIVRSLKFLYIQYFISNSSGILSATGCTAIITRLCHKAPSQKHMV